MTHFMSYLPDDQSRRVVREFLIQIGVGVAVMVAVLAMGLQTGPEVGAATVRVFMFYSIIGCFRASYNRERICAPSLNRWDQAAGYNLCAVGVELVITWPT